jgi:hypothetical protein
MFKSKIGVHAEQSPLRVLLPRDLHIGNAEFEATQENDEIEFEVLGAEFKQNDEQVFVLGKLIKRIPAAAETKPVEAVVPEVEEKPATGSSSGEGGVKTVTVQETKAETKEPVRRKRRLGPASSSLEAPTTLQLNVSREAPASS